MTKKNENVKEYWSFKFFYFLKATVLVGPCRGPNF